MLVSAINDLSTYHTRFQDLCKEILCRGNLLKNKEHVRGGINDRYNLVNTQYMLGFITYVW